MASNDTNYQPQKNNLYGVSSGIPGVIGGSSTDPLLKQARVPTKPSMSEGAPVNGVGEAPSGQEGAHTPESNSFLDSLSEAERNDRMAGISETMGGIVKGGMGWLWRELLSVLR